MRSCSRIRWPSLHAPGRGSGNTNERQRERDLTLDTRMIKLLLVTVGDFWERSYSQRKVEVPHTAAVVVTDATAIATDKKIKQNTRPAIAPQSATRAAARARGGARRKTARCRQYGLSCVFFRATAAAQVLYGELRVQAVDKAGDASAPCRGLTCYDTVSPHRPSSWPIAHTGTNPRPCAHATPPHRSQAAR